MDIRIMDALSKRPYCRLVKNDTHNIAERIRKIEPAYFILRNYISGDYEVHNYLNFGNTYCFTVPFDRLDARTLEYCRKTSTSRNVVARMQNKNDRLDASRERARANDLDNRTREFADRMLFAKKQDTGESHRSTFAM